MQPHTAAVTVETKKFEFELLPHPSYSPDLAPSDYHIFRPLRDALHGHQSANNEEVKGVAL
jgi:histone-lysine N-methyltransferase SETMAR